ncbi:hypothetical protein L228DRAFT_261917 [Xylona heveae TC161]|uniref:Transcription initiation factor TFIID subunit 12 domain-containing protein n=1 Tax=Xylona heveae (strain CBS 132557 / TC161) TaxID=1328760 RepID=A0A165G6A1_XYLHT|nr:hypothetical protein L228DRAFT_261917 [Xylona heveae TC161]KZF21788.1 hypothetical protein L228DRAFT_261917 [Xylona heveae TC161]
MDSTGNSQQPQPQAQPQNPPLIRVEQVRNLHHITDQQKAQYATGIKKLWDVIQSRPSDSPEYQQAHNKLAEVSQSIWTSLKRFQQRAQQQAAQAPAQAQTQTQTQAQQTGINQAQQQAPPPRPATQPPVSQAPPAQPMNPSMQSLQQLAPQILQIVAAFPFTLPPSLSESSPEGEKWLGEAKLRYGQALQNSETATSSLRRLTQMVQQRQTAGQVLSQDDQAKVNQTRARWQKQYADSLRFLESFRKQQADFKNDRARQAEGPRAPAPQAQDIKGVPIQPTAAPLNPMAQVPPNQATAAPNAALDAARAQAAAAVRASMSPSSVSQPQPGQPMAAPAAPAPQNPMMAAQPNPAMPQQSPVQHQPPMGFATPNAPQPPPAQAVAQLPHTASQHNSPVPTGPTPVPTGPPRPLSHQAAMAQAARSYSSALPQGTPQSAGIHAPPPLTSRDSISNNTKWPIPKTLNVPSPQPVAMASARPTLSGGPSNSAMGVIGQPALPKLPHFELEGEGDRVLSKKKLDELVRQVTGGVEGHGGESLAPGVEEAILQVADDFVDQVITSACRLAKLRQSSTLEIRDIQLILERNYNIRVPGYASDEIRTVRKFQPASGWTQKMNAVQAAKVMGGKTDL